MESCNNNNTTNNDHAQDCDDPEGSAEGEDESSKLGSSVLDDEVKVDSVDENETPKELKTEKETTGETVGQLNDDNDEQLNDGDNDDEQLNDGDNDDEQLNDGQLNDGGEGDVDKSKVQLDVPPTVPAKTPVVRRKKRGKRRRFSLGTKTNRSNNCHSPKAKVAKIEPGVVVVVGDGEVNGTDNSSVNHGSGTVNSEKIRSPGDDGKQRVRSSARIVAAHAKAAQELRNKVVVAAVTAPIVKKSPEKIVRHQQPQQQQQQQQQQQHHHHRLDAESNKPQTIIVTETKSLAQVISNAVRKEGGSKEGKPTLVIIETKSPTELVTFPKSTSILSSKVTNTITVETGGGIRKPGPSTTLTPVTLPVQSSIARVPTATALSSASSLAQQLTPAVIEDGGIAVEVPSLVVPYLIEYPPSRTISEFLKMLPLDPKEIKELEEASKKKSMLAAAAAAAAASSNSANATGLYAGVGRPKTADRWGAYYESSLGKFFSEIGLNLAKEWVQTDLVKSHLRKAEKEGRSSRDRTVEILQKGLNDTKEKNEPFHFQLMKCVHCSFRTESVHVMNHHYDYPHERHLDFKCNFCTFQTRVVKDIIFHMEAEHGVHARVERPMCFFQCPLCDFEDNSKAKVTKHSFKCVKKFTFERNLAPPPEFDPPAKRPKVYPIIPPGMSMLPSTTKVGSTTITQIPSSSAKSRISIKPKDMKLSITPSHEAYRTLGSLSNNVYYRSGGVVYSQTPNRTTGQMFVQNSQPVLLSSSSSGSSTYQSNQIYQVLNSSGHLMPVMGSNFGQLNNQRFTILPTATSNSTSGGPTPVALVPNIATAGGPRSMLVGGSARLQPPKPNISITPVTSTGKTSLLQPRTRLPTPSASLAKLGVQNASSFVVCEICDGYIKDLEQLRTHMQWIHKVKIHPKMIFNRPPLNCQKCQFRFFTDQGLERHLLGAHGLVTSSMQENANKGQDSGRCTICGKVFQWKLLAHMSKDHNMILKPAHLSYKCTVCAATFGMYKLFETHVYQAHSTVAKRVLDAPDDKKESVDGEKARQVAQVAACPKSKKPGMSAAVSSSNKRKSQDEDDDDVEEEEADDVIATTTSATATAATASTTTALTTSATATATSSIEKVKSEEASDKEKVCTTDKDEDEVGEEDDGSDDQVMVEDGMMDNGNEQEALDMEVDDVDHPSPDSVHTEDDDDVVEAEEEEEQVTEVY